MSARYLTALSCIVALILGILPLDIPFVPPVEQVHAAIDDPSDVSHLVLWLDADDTSTLFTDSSCTTSASSGNTIACWQDKSGSGSHVTQISGDCAEQEAGTQTCNLPTYTIDQFNARDALVFDRTNKDALRHTLSSTWNGNFTVFIAFEQVGTPAEFYSFFSNGTPAGNTHFQIDNDASGNFRWNASDTKLTIEAYSNTLKLYTVRGDSSNTTTYADGEQQSTSATTPGRTFEHYRINQNRNGNHLNNAKIAEVIVYQRDLTDCELENVSIYLGDKYGRDFFGIGDNYGFSAPYDNDVNGIGAPSSSCSPANTITSAQSDILTVSNPSTMTTNDFLTFGHNGSVTTLSSNTPTGYTQRIRQIWRMDEDGDANGVGTVTVSFDLTGTNIGTGNILNFALLTDSDDDFSNATVITSGRSFNGNTLSFTGVDFSNGDYVSLAIKNDDVPGSVGSGLLLWLDANDPDDDGNSGNNPSDGSTVSVWHDRSGNNNDATIVSGETAATYQSDAGNLINNHPVMYFDRTAQSDGSVYETTGVDIRAGTNEDITIFTVYRPNEDSLGGSNHHGLWGADNGAWDRFFATNHASFGDGTNDGLASLGPVSQGVVVEDAGEVDTVRVMAAVYDGEVSGGVNSGPANGSTIYFNGNVVTRFTDETDDLAAQDHLYIGWDGDDGAYDGDIAEMIVYNRILSCTEFNNVTAYLSNKYGQSFNTISPGGVSCSLGAWLKADAGVTESSSKVSQWDDQSGNDYDVTQGTNNNRPNFVSSAINFNPALEFKGNSEGDSLRDYLDFSSGDAAAMHGTENSYFFVFSPASTSHLHHLYYIGDGTGNTYNGGGDGADQLEEHFGVEDSGGFKPRYFAQDGTSSEHLINIYADNAVSADEVVLMSVVRPDTTGELFVNGVSQGTDTVNGDAKAATNTRIGGHQASINYERFFEGNLAELVVYTADVTTNDQQKIESYLAMKYGLTLSGGTLNYLSSSGTIVWDADANSSYGNDITALGREDLSSLSQYKSKSEHSDSIVTMSGSAANFTDHEFMLWGNDNGSLSAWSSTDAPGGYARVAREWNIQETGDAGTVTISVDDSDLPASVENVWLLTDADGTFANATLNSMTESSGTWSTTFNPGNGSYFSFAVPMNAPGGVSSGMTLWLKAGDGVTGTTEVSDWADQSGSSHDFTQGTSSNRPALTNNAINFNPAITFDGSSDFLEDADGEDYLNGETTYSSFAVVDSDATNDGFIWFSSNETSNSEAPWGLRYDQSGYETGHSNIMKFGVGTTSDAHKLYEIDENNAVTTDPLLVDIQWTSGSEPEINLFNTPKPVQVDGGSSTIGGSITGADYIRIGRQSQAGHSYWDGHIAELIFYEEDVTEAEEAKIVSYLGIKYGLTLSGGTVNYLSSSGVTVWDATANSSYNNDIAGLGRDDTSTLTQYKSQSVHSDAILTMSGSAANFSNHEFLIWGNDNGATAETESSTPGSVRKRLERVWRVDETGDTGNLTITFDLTGLTVTGTEAKHFTLITDSDTNFEQSVTTQIAASYSSNIVTFTNVNVSDGTYIALGTDIVAPGGVSTDLQLWLRGDLGVSPASGSLTGWTDQTANNTFTVNGNPQTGNAAVNFNNVIMFDGNGDYLDGDTTIDMRTLFSVFDDTAQAGDVLFGPAEETAGATQGYFWRYVSSNAYIGDTSSHYTRTTTTPPAGTFLYCAEKKGGSVGTDSRIAFNGTDQPMGSYGSNNPVDQHTSTPRVARGTDSNVGTNVDFTGNIAEIAVYGGSGMSTTDEQKINSYLGIKYGVTLSGGTVNYLSASGVVIWGTGSNVGYTSDIAGIGRDDASDLDQYRSISLNSDAVITMSGSAGNFTNHEFLLWANNNEPLSFGPSASTVDANEHLRRIWKVQETGDTGAVSVTFSGSYIRSGWTYYLLSDDDGNFGNGGTTQLSKAVSTTNAVAFAGINPTNGQYLTIAQHRQKNFFQWFFFGL